MKRLSSVLADPERRILDWFTELGMSVPSSEPFALRWTGYGYDRISVDDAVEDEDLVIGATDFYPFGLKELAAGCVFMVLESQETYPGRRSWRRWRLTGWVAGQLYQSGLTRSGGSFRVGGGDPLRGGTYTLPKLGTVLPRRNGTMRPYLLWKRSWWWECHARQGLKVRGRHRPKEPLAFGVCAACVPCPECGAEYDCVPGCPL